MGTSTARVRGTAAVVSTLLLGGALAYAAPAGAAAGYETVVQWGGGKTKACRIDSDDGSSKIKVYWDGRNYVDDGSGLRNTGSGGLAHVDANFDISGWTYSTGKPGGVGPVVSMTFDTDWYVYFLAGSGVGICKEKIVPVTSVAKC